MILRSLPLSDPPLTRDQAAARFTVPCRSPNTPGMHAVTSPQLGSAVVEPSQPRLAQSWRLAWRIPSWVRPGGGAVAAALSPSVTAIWSSVIPQGLSVVSTPSSPLPGPSYLSATVNAQQVTVTLLTERESMGSSRSQGQGSLRGGGGGGGGGHGVGREEIFRLVADGLDALIETSSAGRETAMASKGSTVLSLEVQEFSNFLRVPFVSNAFIAWDVATSKGDGDGGDGGCGDDAQRGRHVAHPPRPIVATALEVKDAVVSLSSTATQCFTQCLSELTAKKDSGARSSSDPGNGSGCSEGVSEGVSAPVARPRKEYIISNCTDRALLFGQVSTTEAIVIKPSSSMSYRWRTIPSSATPGVGLQGGKGDSSSLILLLRLALPSADKGRGVPRDVHQPGGGSALEAWTEAFPADIDGTYMVGIMSAA